MPPTGPSCWLRWIALVAAFPCLAVTAFAAWLAINGRQRDAEAHEFEVRTHQVLDRVQEVSGLKLPAGTELEIRLADGKVSIPY